MRILASSDIHLGRIPAVSGHPELSGYCAWEAIVEKALALEVDALVLAGDVVEKDNAWFEAYGPLVKGLEKLHSSNIEVFAVAGNHDAKIFPRLAKEGEHIHMLGLKGKWEQVTYKGVRFVGWSFSESACTTNPLDSFDKSFADFDGPTLGLLHCDVDGQVGGMYASIPSFQFSNTGISLWVLGHIHAKQQIANQPCFYCGSPFALDSSETGEHGVYLLETLGEKSWKDPQFIPLSPWQFCDCEVDLEGIASSSDLMGYIAEAMRKTGSGKITSAFLGDIYCKLVFVGTIPTKFDLTGALPLADLQNLEIPLEGGYTAHVQSSFVDNTVLAVDLESLAKGVGPIALLAKQLLDMDTLPGLLEAVKDLEHKSHNVSAFQSLREVPGQQDPKKREALIRKASLSLLRSMLAEREGGMV
jgi:hypothetical protein